MQIAIVVPCYNEGEMLGISVPRLVSLIDDLVVSHGCSPHSYIVLVDDGSGDDTWNLIESAAERYPVRVRGLRLSCNVGHQGALLSGLDYVSDRCDAAVSIDADLQDDLAAIPRMIQELRKGAEIVLGVRVSRKVDTWFKRNTALGFYKFMRLLGVDLVENHADFRMMSNAVLRNLRLFSETNLFLRGLPSLLSSKISTVSYERAERIAGETKYPLRKMLALAWNGITSFSIVPLRLISAVGGGVFLLSLIMSIYAVFGMLTGKALPGWTSIVLPLYLLGGMLMLSIGVVGEYVGKVFMETKRRPRFLVNKVIGEHASYDRD
ncbi:glycosyltransferase family 2 protein [Laribacter hongkongensis]|nr:glycosyltransferase family 2 protein [Laribacter hongkongensis]MCG8992290.1 glycosyltransferase family 2 protein [Laribacter hongkongensis]MCG8999049.1 glycosyltransferase family 2 protein [Laribacter hongkongensis]MCG9001736.1 glycosyltransferase family 2 protein [Laribacter hongkongensis]MCG9004986.1 glycosyltransferase family 2 protein [Laribacter hongkongensis]MCG9007206.1 glycosyltransferase family 2 protein [Laribacter hongkongensis]